MFYPLMDFDCQDSEAVVEDWLQLETRTLRCSAGEAWELTCFRVLWLKYDTLTAPQLREARYTATDLLDPVLAYERTANYDLNMSFSYWVAETYENVRQARLKVEGNRC